MVELAGQKWAVHAWPVFKHYLPCHESVYQSHKNAHSSPSDPLAAFRGGGHGKGGKDSEEGKEEAGQGKGWIKEGLGLGRECK